MHAHRRIIVIIVEAPRFRFFEDCNLGFPKVICTGSAGWIGGGKNACREGIYFILPVGISCKSVGIKALTAQDQEGLTSSLLLLQTFYNLCLGERQKNTACLGDPRWSLQDGY